MGRFEQRDEKQITEIGMKTSYGKEGKTESQPVTVRQVYFFKLTQTFFMTHSIKRERERKLRARRGNRTFPLSLKPLG